MLFRVVEVARLLAATSAAGWLWYDLRKAGRFRAVQAIVKRFKPSN
jgi:hypothetical protein